MIRKELTLEATYVPNWGLNEGIREFISNAFDAQTEMSCEIDVHYDDERKKLFIVTKGAVLSREVLLFGHSSKAERGDTIGHFGEGLKLGSLACVRAGYNIIIRTGSETWRPIICRSETYNANVLAVEINKGNKYQNRVAVEIENISLKEWIDIKNSFLKLNPIIEDNIVKSPYYGEILFDPKFKGQIFVKGVKVEFVPDFKYGYNLFNAETDRDRKMVNSWDLKYYVRAIWSHAVNSAPKNQDKFIDIISNGHADIKVDSINEMSYNDETLENIVNDFKTKYGENAYPVSNTTEAREVEFFGMNGIIVENAYRLVLYKDLGTLEQLKDKYKNATSKIYNFNELSEDEKNAVNEAIKDINMAVSDFNINSFEIVDFLDSSLNGLFNSANGRIFIARKIINDFNKLRIVLIHEITHSLGEDGAKSHEDAMCEIWAEMFAGLKNEHNKI
jgi:hypothetical protein